MPHKKHTKDLAERIPYLPNDYRDCNSYLLPYIKEIRETYEDATIIQIVRHPAKVIRSILGTRPASFLDTCKYWADSNKKLRELGIPFIRLEDLRGTPVNVKKKNYYAYKFWPQHDKDTFKEVCGEEMKYYNYETLET